MDTRAAHQFSSESPPPETTTMTVEEFNDLLTGENVIEGFSCQVAELFE